MLKWLLVSGLVIVLDQLTKLWASAGLNYAEPVPVFPLFNLTLMHNTGAAFSFLSQGGGWQRWFFALLALVISIALVMWLKRLQAGQRWLAVASIAAMALADCASNPISSITIAAVSKSTG